MDTAVSVEAIEKKPYTPPEVRYVSGLVRTPDGRRWHLRKRFFALTKDGQPVESDEAHGWEYTPCEEMGCTSS
jgi:hypothetical protein